MMDLDQIVVIASIWLIVGIAAYASGWYALIPATWALIGTVVVARS